MTNEKRGCKQEKSERDGVLTLGDATTSLEKSVEESTRIEDGNGNDKREIMHQSEREDVYVSWYLIISECW